MDVLNLNEKQKEFFKQYIEKYAIKREGDGFWKLIEIQMALKAGTSFEALELLTAEDYTSEQLEQGRIAVADGIPLDIIQTFYQKEKSAKDMREARESFIFNQRNSEQQTETLPVMEMSDAEYLSRYLPAEGQEEKKDNREKLAHLERVVDVLEQRLTEFQDKLEESYLRMEKGYQKELAGKEEIINHFRERLNDYEREKELWSSKEREYKRELEEYQSFSVQKDKDIRQSKLFAENMKKISAGKRIFVFFMDKTREGNKRLLENIIIKGNLSAEQLEVVNEAINSGFSAGIIKKIANKKYTVEKMQQLILFYRNQKGETGKRIQEKGEEEEREQISEKTMTDESRSDLEQKYNLYEEQYSVDDQGYDGGYSDDYQEEYEEDDE